jgi:TonB-linked SusC/RagA family outer membrane protein
MKKLVLSLFIWLSLSVAVLAQERTVTGTVISSEDKLPIPGASIKVKEAPSNGAATGADGRFSVKVPATGKTLIISFLGHKTLEVKITANNLGNITLANDSKILEEVVVTGVGVATLKRLVPIDVATLSSKEFPKSATTNVTQALQGQIAGAQIVQRSGQPGSSPLIILRGYTNLAGTAPLILIDGVQSSADLLTSLDPNIVDRIEVVKGSAGGMLYGAQGGNGVIQIFTKRGAKNSQLIIDASSKYSNDQVLRSNDLLATSHHWVTDAAGNITATGGAILAPNAIGVWPDPVALPYGTDKNVQNNKPFLLPIFDHIEQGNRVANTFNNSFSIRGGSEKTDYAFGASNLSQQDVYSNTFNRTNLTINFGFNPVKGLTIRNSTQLIYAYEDLLSSNRFNLVNSLQWIDFNFINPTTGRHVVKPSTLTDNNNALAEREVHERNSKTPRLVQNFNVNYKFTKFVELDLKYALDNRRSDGYDYYKNQSGLPQTVFYGGNINGSIDTDFSDSRTTYGNASLYLRTDFKEDFKINLPIKTTTQLTYDNRREKSRSFFATGTGLPPYPPYTINGSTTKTSGDGYSESLLFGYLINQSIDYANLVGISAGFRSDYSSAFGGQSKPFTFPRGTIYFNPSEFFASHNLITNWKLRAAYGEAGVQPGAYDRQVTFNSGTLGTGGSSIYTRSQANNPDLSVQTTKELEVGTDLNMTPFKGNWLSSVTFNGTYWDRSSKNVIQGAPVSPSTGASTTLDNLISLKSNGLDLSLDVNTYKSTNLNWFVGLRWAKSKTSITEISNNLPITNGAFNLAPGGNLGDMYMQSPLHSVNQLKPDGTRYIALADVSKYTMVDGHVVLISNYNVVLTAANDLSVVGNANPDFTASLINRFTIYKNLNVGFQLDWIKGNSIYNQTRQWLYRDRLHADFDKPVTIDGQTGAFVAYYNSFYNTNTPVSTFIEDGSYVRLRDVSLSYDLTGMVKQKWLRSLVITLTGRNLATWTKYKGLDPEATSAVTNQGGTIGRFGSFQGVDYYTAPNLKSYQLSLNIGF